MGAVGQCRGRWRYGLDMAKKKGLAGAVRRLATPVEELDREQLRDFCTMLGITPTTDIQVARTRAARR